MFSFLRPETLAEWVSRPEQIRSRLQSLPSLEPAGLWNVQEKAIVNLEKSFAKADSRALIQMATGSGKTFTAVNIAYRLLKFGGAKRILFLVDRGNLGKQTEDEFANFTPPDDTRKFPELYTVQRLKSNAINPAAKVVITTIQRLYSMLKDEVDFDPANEEGSAFDSAKPWRGDPPDVVYNKGIPPEFFDFVVVDECHRSIYELWAQVLLYFDSFLVGLTATPAGKTIGFFNQNLVMQYGHDEAVTDGVNVDFDVYRIRTRITEQGATIASDESGVYVDKRHKLTRAERLERLNQDLTYTANELDRDVVSESQLRTVLRQFRDNVLPEAFPGRSEVPKTLIFAKDDSHADDIVRMVREEFAEKNDFCEKITYRTGFTRRVKRVKMQPTPQDRICDPAAGTGGFLFTAYNYVLDKFEKDLNRDEKRAVREGLVEGMELSPKVARMCAMNLYLHGIGGDKVVVYSGHDSLAAPWNKEYSMILANRPFGKSQSLLFVNEEGDTEQDDQVIVREDFWTSTSNKQLNFVQHMFSLLRINGRAAVVLPDNVLFKGGAGEKVRRNLLEKCNVHTLLRLPTGIWYSPGVKANVLFFDKKEGRPEPWTERLWVYDLRTNKHFTQKQSPITRRDFDEFVACFSPGAVHKRKATWSEENAEGRWRSYSYDEIAKRDKLSLDLFWIKDKSLTDTDSLPAPGILATEIVDELEAALAQFAKIAARLQKKV